MTELFATPPPMAEMEYDAVLRLARALRCLSVSQDISQFDKSRAARIIR